MALKDEGLSVNLWDDWSRSDSRYEHGICAKKWNSFSGSGVGVGTIFHYAETYGDWSRSRDLDWDDGIYESDYYHDVYGDKKFVNKVSAKGAPYKVGATYLWQMSIDID